MAAAVGGDDQDMVVVPDTGFTKEVDTSVNSGAHSDLDKTGLHGLLQH